MTAIILDPGSCRHGTLHCLRWSKFLIFFRVERGDLLGEGLLAALQRLQLQRLCRDLWVLPKPRRRGLLKKRWWRGERPTATTLLNLLFSSTRHSRDRAFRGPQDRGPHGLAGGPQIFFVFGKKCSDFLKSDTLTALSGMTPRQGRQSQLMKSAAVDN